MMDEPKSAIQEEKRRILEMLERKQISVQEANDLIVALEEGEQVRRAHQRASQEAVFEQGWLGELIDGVVRFSIKGKLKRSPGPRWP